MSTLDPRPTIDHFRAVLNTEIEHRRERPGLTWIELERNAMHDEVNRLRARRGLGPVDPVLLRRAESLAEGHIDYVQKFAIGCAELVWTPEAVTS